MDNAAAESYWEQVVNAADHVVWDDEVRDSVRCVYAYLVGTLAQTEIADCAQYALPWSFTMHVAALIHGMEAQGWKGVQT